MQQPGPLVRAHLVTGDLVVGRLARSTESSCSSYGQPILLIGGEPYDEWMILAMDMLDDSGHWQPIRDWQMAIERLPIA